MTYTYRNAQTGKVCCSSDNPAYLCDACKRQHANRSQSAADRGRALAQALVGHQYADALRTHENARLAMQSDPSFWGDDYSPTGVPPDSYALGLALRAAEDAERTKHKAVRK